MQRRHCSAGAKDSRLAKMGGIMNGKLAAVLFLCVCATLAILLLAGAVTPLASGSMFAAALIMLGGLSRGFRTRSAPK